MVHCLMVQMPETTMYFFAYLIFLTDLRWGETIRSKKYNLLDKVNERGTSPVRYKKGTW